MGGRRRQLPYTLYHSGLFQFVACACTFIYNRFFKVVLIITSKDKELTSRYRAHSCVNLFPSLAHLA